MPPDTHAHVIQGTHPHGSIASFGTHSHSFLPDTVSHRTLPTSYASTFTAPYDPTDLTSSTRTERTIKVSASLMVDRRFLGEHPEFVEAETKLKLMRHLAHACEKQGRVVIGETQMSSEEDHMRDAVIYKLTAATIEDQSGEWPSIRAALREDGIL